jgi:hypothetical protein
VRDGVSVVGSRGLAWSTHRVLYGMLDHGESDLASVMTDAMTDAMATPATTAGITPPLLWVGEGLWGGWTSCDLDIHRPNKATKIPGAVDCRLE